MTGVGSLPGADWAAAVDQVAGLQMPFCPELPARQPGGLVEQLLGSRDLLAPTDKAWVQKITDRAAFIEKCKWHLHGPSPGLGGLLAAHAAGRLDEARALKVQRFGPVTLAATLSCGGEPALKDGALVEALAARVQAQAEQDLALLAASGLPVILVIDEPMLGALPDEAVDHGPLDALARLLGALGPQTAMIGLHCCSAPRWDRLARLPLDLLSFDPAMARQPLLSNRTARKLASRAVIAWGLVPTNIDPRTLDADVIFEAWRENLHPQVDPVELARRALITASCGLAGLPADQVGPSFALAAAIGARMRGLASGQRN